jgi:hypothetical protein
LGDGKPAHGAYTTLLEALAPPLVIFAQVDRRDSVEVLLRLARQLRFEVATWTRSTPPEGLVEAIQTAASSRTSTEI